MMNESNCLTPPPRLYRITSFTKLKSWEQQTQEELGSIEVTMSDSSSMGQTSMAQPFGITVSSSRTGCLYPNALRPHLPLFHNITGEY
jgi:hypothetical protein